MMEQFTSTVGTIAVQPKGEGLTSCLCMLERVNALVGQQRTKNLFLGLFFLFFVFTVLTRFLFVIFL
jgi:hypothetical protein